LQAWQAKGAWLQQALELCEDGVVDFTRCGGVQEAFAAHVAAGPPPQRFGKRTLWSKVIDLAKRFYTLLGQHKTELQQPHRRLLPTLSPSQLAELQAWRNFLWVQCQVGVFSKEQCAGLKKRDTSSHSVQWWVDNCQGQANPAQECQDTFNQVILPTLHQVGVLPRSLESRSPFVPTLTPAQRATLIAWQNWAREQCRHHVFSAAQCKGLKKRDQIGAHILVIDGPESNADIPATGTDKRATSTTLALKREMSVACDQGCQDGILAALKSIGTNTGPKPTLASCPNPDWCVTAAPGHKVRDLDILIGAAIQARSDPSQEEFSHCSSESDCNSAPFIKRAINFLKRQFYISSDPHLAAIEVPHLEGEKTKREAEKALYILPTQTPRYKVTHPHSRLHARSDPDQEDFENCPSGSDCNSTPFKERRHFHEGHSGSAAQINSNRLVGRDSIKSTIGVKVKRGDQHEECSGGPPGSDCNSAPFKKRQATPGAETFEQGHLTGA
jgi:hypothetical protein